MHRRGKGRGRTLGALIVAVVVASSAYAFTQSNTVPATRAGDGNSAISGFTATSVVYTLNATDPQNIDAVAFTLNPTSATTVKTQFASGGSWYDCTNTAGSVTCTTTSPQATVAAATLLTVVAVD